MTTPVAYPWSSAKAHIDGGRAEFLAECFLTGIINDWKMYLLQEDEKQAHQFRRHTNTGRPFGDHAFVSALEKKIGRQFIKGKPGPKLEPKQAN